MQRLVQLLNDFSRKLADLVWDLMTERRKRRDSAQLRAGVERRSHGLGNQLSIDVRTNRNLEKCSPSHP